MPAKEVFPDLPRPSRLDGFHDHVAVDNAKLNRVTGLEAKVIAYFLGNGHLTFAGQIAHVLQRVLLPSVWGKELLSESSPRLRRFEQFVQADAQRKLDDACAHQARLLAGVEAFECAPARVLQALDTLAVQDELLVAEARIALAAAQEAKSELLDTTSDELSQPVGSTDETLATLTNPRGLPAAHLDYGPMVEGLPAAHLDYGPMVEGLPAAHLDCGPILEGSPLPHLIARQSSRGSPLPGGSRTTAPRCFIPPIRWAQAEVCPHEEGINLRNVSKGDAE